MKSIKWECVRMISGINNKIENGLEGVESIRYKKV